MLHPNKIITGPMAGPQRAMGRQAPMWCEPSSITEIVGDRDMVSHQSTMTPTVVPEFLPKNSEGPCGSRARRDPGQTGKWQHEWG